MSDKFKAKVRPLKWMRSSDRYRYWSGEYSIYKKPGGWSYATPKPYQVNFSGTLSGAKAACQQDHDKAVMPLLEIEGEV